MKQLIISFLLWTILLSVANGQRIQIDSLKAQLMKVQPDTSRVLTMVRLATMYAGKSTDSSILIAQQALKLARRTNYMDGQMRALSTLARSLRYSGNLPKALSYEFDILRMARANHHQLGELSTLNNIGAIYGDLGENRQALTYFIQFRAKAEALSNPKQVAFVLPSIANMYVELGLLDSAQFINQQAYGQFLKTPDFLLEARVLTNFGRIEAAKGNTVGAFRFFRKALSVWNTRPDTNSGKAFILSRTELQMAELFDKLNQTDSSIRYARRALLTAQDIVRLHSLKASNLLVKQYKTKNRIDTAFYYGEIARAISDSLFGLEKFRQLQKLLLTEQQNQQTLIADGEKYQTRIQIYALLAGLVVIVLIALLLWRNNQLKTKTNLQLRGQNEEIDRQRDKAERALSELKTTQVQLIQKEKLASLGELTAGIAHEIQNPLNFVNNFSEVSAELVDELEDELTKGDTEEAKAIAGDIRQNLHKIYHHGGRAAAIVRGMLEHSRTESGEKRPTNLNSLAGEYLKIAYHGLRAKEKGFNCELGVDFDPNLSRVTVSPQEIGRVLLNLYNNAFYAVSEHAKQNSSPDYKPRVSVITRRETDQVIIRVCDNGPGISESVQAKIFQPFFTTKPTGEGTGLGLSLSYDIITKGHGGTLKVESQEGEGTEFFIGIPA